MATADDYAAWIVANEGKKGTPEFETVVAAYKEAIGEQPAQPTAKPYDVPAGVASMMNIGQGITFGFGDELAGLAGRVSKAGLDAFPGLSVIPGIEGLAGFDKERYRETLKQFENEYPGSALLGKVSGGLLPIGGGAQLAKINPWLATSLAGGAAGALQGAGDAPNLQETPKDALTQGVVGAIFGPALMGSMKAVTPVVNAISKAPAVGTPVATRLAQNRIIEALQRDEIDAATAIQRLQELGPEGRLADVGTNTRNLLDTTATFPGQTAAKVEEAIRQRIAGRPDRMDAIVDLVNQGQGRMSSLQAYLDGLKKQAGPIYAKVHQSSINSTPDLDSALDAARKLGAFAQAKKIATAERVPFSLDAQAAGPMSMRDLDYVKRGVDALIEKETDSVTGKVTSLGRAYIDLKKNLVSELDNASPLYKVARDKFAGPAALENAMNQGRNFLKENAEGVKQMMAGLSLSEKEAFRVGAAEALRDKFGDPKTQNQFIDAWKNRNVRERLKELLGDDAQFSDVLRMLKTEETLKKLEGTGRGSQTARRQFAAEDMSDNTARDALSLGVSAKTGNPVGMFDAVKRLSTRATTPEPVRNVMGDILLGRYSPEAEKALLEAQKAFYRQRGKEANVSGRAGAVGAGMFTDFMGAR